MARITLISALSSHFVFVCIFFETECLLTLTNTRFFHTRHNTHHIVLAHTHSHTRTHTLPLIPQIWDLSMGKCIATLQTSDQPVTCVDFHPSEFICAVGGGTHALAP